MKEKVVAFVVALLVVFLGVCMFAVAAVYLDLPGWTFTIAGMIWGALVGPEVYYKCGGQRPE